MDSGDDDNMNQSETREESRSVIMTQYYRLPSRAQQCPNCYHILLSDKLYRSHLCLGINNARGLTVYSCVMIMFFYISMVTLIVPQYKDYKISTLPPRFLVPELYTMPTFHPEERHSQAHKSCYSLIYEELYSDTADTEPTREMSWILAMVKEASRIITEELEEEYKPVYYNYAEDLKIPITKNHERLEKMQSSFSSGLAGVEKAVTLLKKLADGKNYDRLNNFENFKEYRQFIRSWREQNFHAKQKESILFDLCKSLHIYKWSIKSKLRVITESIKPYEDLDQYYDELPQLQKQKEAEWEYDLMIFRMGFFLRILITITAWLIIPMSYSRIVLATYTELYMFIMTNERLWKSSTALKLTTTFAMLIAMAMKPVDLYWSIVWYISYPLRTLSTFMSWVKSKREETREEAWLEYITVKLQDNYIYDRMVRRNASHEKKQKFDKSLELPIEEDMDKNNSKALIEGKYLRTIFQQTLAKNRLLIPDYSNKKIDEVMNERKTLYELQRTSSEEKEGISSGYFHCVSETYIEQTIELLKRVTSLKTDEVMLYEFQLARGVNRMNETIDEYSVEQHTVIISLCKGLLHISPKEFCNLGCRSQFYFKDDLYKEVWYMANFVLKKDEVRKALRLGDMKVLRLDDIKELTSVQLSAAVKGLAQNLNQTQYWTKIIMDCIENFIKYFSENANFESNNLLTLAIYQTAVFLNDRKIVTKCLDLFEVKNSARPIDYHVLLIDIWESLSLNAESTSSGSVFNENYKLPDLRKIADSSSDPWWFTWETTPPTSDTLVLDVSMLKTTQASFEETKERSKTHTQYLREAPPKDVKQELQFHPYYSTIKAGTRHVLCLLFKPIGIVPNDLSQTWEYGTEITPMNQNGNDKILHTKLRKKAVYHARKFIYCALTNEWMYSSTIIVVDEELEIDQAEKGKLRDLIKVTLLENDQAHVLKINRDENQHHIQKYLADIRTHQLSRYYVQLFTQITKDRFIRLRMLDAVHIQLLEDANSKTILDYGNAEPRMEGYKFLKFTNNTGRVNDRMDIDLHEITTAFTHFTYHYSKGALIVTDLQGWLRLVDDDIEITLTDPAISCPKAMTYFFGLTDQKDRGFKRFWNGQHPTCNRYCKELGLARPGWL